MLRWTGGVAIALICLVVLAWEGAVVASDDNWGASITKWRLFAVALAAAAGLVG